MADTLTFRGSKTHVINQLGKYMSKTSSQKFFAQYFEQNSTSAPTKLTHTNVSPRRSKSTSYHSKSKTTAAQIKTIIREQSKNTQNLSPEVLILTKHTTQFGDISTVAPYGAARQPQLNRRQPRVQCHNLKKRTPFKPIFQQELDNVHIVLNKQKRTPTYQTTIKNIALVGAIIGGDYALKCFVNIDIVGTALAAITTIFGLNRNQNPDKEDWANKATCITSIVANKGFLPKYTTLTNSMCKNLCLECNSRQKSKCKISCAELVDIVNDLLEKKILVIQEQNNSNKLTQE